MKKIIYLDNNATTALDPHVIKAIEKEIKQPPSNPSSIHQYGQHAKKRLADARYQIASYLKTKPHELIFTSSGTEAVNMIIRGLFPNKEKGHIITTDIEHSCIYQTVLAIKDEGCEATFLQTGLSGAPVCEQIEKAIQENTRLIVLSAVNSETGVRLDLEQIAAMAKKHGIFLLIDAVALLGKDEIDIYPGISAMCFSSHKIHGPKGLGLAYIRTGSKLSPLLTGGPQEFQRRAGTENLISIIGFAQAVALLSKHLPTAKKHMQNLRDYFEKRMKEEIPSVIINGQGLRICNISNITFPGVDGESLLILLDQKNILASHGSACSAGALEPSRVLLNMGIPKELAKSSLRFSLSRFTKKEEIDLAIETIVEIVRSFK